MANWEKLNKEFEDALDSMTDKEWDEFKKRIDLKREEKQALNLHSVSGSVIDVLKQMAECPNTVDSATVPKAGIEAAPEQVVVNLSVNYTKYKRLLEVVKHYR